MVREISMEVREKAGNFVFTFVWEPCIVCIVCAKNAECIVCAKKKVNIHYLYA